MPALRIIIACGGTGGHVFPGVATGQVLQRRGHDVSLWLSGRSVENETLHGWTGTVFRTGAQPLRLRNFFSFIITLVRTWRAIRREKPDVLLAMGCYSSVSPVLAARLAGVPVVLHEANAVPGKAVALLSHFARVTALTFADAARWLPGRRTIPSGMPVRNNLTGLQPLDGCMPGVGFTLLVTGGSLGAHAVNELVCEAAILLRQQGMTDLHIIHQCGLADEAGLQKRYAVAGVDAKVFGFLREMGRAYASADFAICRAGAATCAELCLCGVPALLIPLPTAVRDHQRLNAEAMVRDNGADLRIQSELTPEFLAAYVIAIRADAPKRAAMRKALLGLAAPDAADKLADIIERASKTR
jgi:UDP-N-acetylglucosamine--N-acetylmuramyl-(pentapeptide) pyrophosphoryl-undecaprenol N-acetylglucosamine transferase